MYIKKVAAIIMIMALLLTGSVFGLGQAPYSYYRSLVLNIDQTEATANYESITLEAAPYVVDGRTLVPFRALGDALGAVVGWDADKRQASLKLDQTQVVVELGSTVAYVDGEKVLMEVKPEIKNGRTFIPLRFVSESLGANVNYFAKTRSILIEYVETANWLEYTDQNDYVYNYPSDWTKVDNQGGTGVTFTSPKGSVLDNYLLKAGSDDVYMQLKASILSDGWTQDPTNVDDEDRGTGMYEMQFTQKDATTGSEMIKVVYIVPLAEETWVGEGVTTVDHYEYDAAIMAKITLE